MRVRTEGDRLIAWPVPPALRRRIKTLRGASFLPLEQAYSLPATREIAKSLDRAAPAAEWDPDAAELLPPVDEPEGELDRTPLLDGLEPAPYRQQEEAFAAAAGEPGFGWWIGMGGGKSRLAVNEALRLGADQVVVTCTMAALEEDKVWQREFFRWAEGRYLVAGLVLGRGGQLRIGWKDVPERDKRGEVKMVRKVVAETDKQKAKPSVADRLKALQDAQAQAKARGLGFVAVVPWDSYWRGGLGKWLLAQQWDLWIGDEVHRAKAPGSKISMFGARLARHAKARRFLTGNPIPQSRLDAYGVYRSMDWTVFGTNYSRFKRTYAIWKPVPNTPKAEMPVAWINEEDFEEKFHSRAYVWETDRETLGLEEPVWLESRFVVEPECRRVYQDLEADLIAEVDSGAIVAKNALVKLLRLQQVLSGVVSTAEGPKARVGFARQKAVLDRMEALRKGTPLVCICRFLSDLDAVHAAAKELGRESAELSGRVKGGLEWWKAGNAEILALQIQAGAESIDLTRASHAFLVSVGASLSDYDQVLKRLDRPGQAHAVTYTKFIAELAPGLDSVDAENYAALDGKQDAVQAILRARQGRRR